MSAIISKKTDGGDAKAEAFDNEEDSPIVSRTRSGRRLRTPAAKTPVRRTRKSVVREDPAENTESRQESPSDDCTADTKGGQCSSAREPACPDMCTSTPADVSQESVMDAAGSESIEKKSKRVPLGKPKSGRIWKDRNKQRFSALLRDKPLRSSWEKKMEAKREKQLVKQYQQQLKDEQTREKEEKKKRRAENLRRRAENERKAEIVQVIKNTAKIKRMKKKQLRKIEKRDTLLAVQKTPPSVKKGAGKTNSSL